MTPKPIPAEAGCLVVRVSEPRSLFEATQMAAGATVWRMTLWAGGGAWHSAITGERPTLATCLQFFHDVPSCWTTVAPLNPA